MSPTAQIPENSPLSAYSDVIDRAAVLDRVGGDEELLREIAAIFLDEYPVLLNQIQSAALDRDANALERAAHSLKGSVSNFGAQAATQAAYHLELLGRSGQLDEAEPAIQALLSHFQQLQFGLKRLAS